MLYRSNIDRVLCPHICIATRSDTPALTRFRIAVRRMSCSNRPGTFAVAQASCRAGASAPCGVPASSRTRSARDIDAHRLLLLGMCRFEHTHHLKPGTMPLSRRVLDRRSAFKTNTVPLTGHERWGAVTLAAAFLSTVIACSPQQTGGSSPERLAAEPTGLRLYVFDCGTLQADPARFRLKREEVATTALSVPCFLVAHPKGRLIWDAGAVPDADTVNVAVAPAATVRLAGCCVICGRPLPLGTILPTLPAPLAR